MSDPSSWIRDLAHALPEPPTGERSYSAARLTKNSCVRVALGHQGFALLVPSGDAELRPNVHLKNLNVLQRVSCRIVDTGESIEDTFAMVECTSPESSVQDLFLETLGLLVLDQQVLTPAALAHLLDSLVSLFRGIDASPKTSTLGLWGELWLLANASRPDLASESWHRSPTERWDFSKKQSRVEVKTAAGTRRHRFSLEQLCPPPGVDVVVASVVTTESTSGSSILDLLERAVSRAPSTDISSQLVTTAMSSLGSGWLEGREQRFDDALAAHTVRFLRATDVPRVADPPSEVTHVQFEADVEDVDPLETSSLPEGSLAASLVPEPAA